MTNEALRTLRKRVRVAGGLPVFSKTLQDVLELIHAQDLAMPVLARAIEKDPALTARVLKLANSAFYGLSQQVASLNLALVLLGMRNVQSMVLSLGFLDVLAEADEDGPYPGPGFRTHSFMCGRAGMLIAHVHQVSSGGEEFVAGLIHDLGKLVLFRAYPERVADEGARLEGRRGAELVAAEQAVFGLSHCEAGAWAAGEWNLPATVVEAIARHEVASESPDPAHLADVVEAADTLVYWLEAADDSDEVPEAWASHPILGHPDLDAARLRDALTDQDAIGFA